MEQIKINERLLTAVPFVRENSILADIGTDHAYLPIYLIQNGKISGAIAADINRGPLDKAEENIEKFGLCSQIRTVLCDGITKIAPSDMDDIAIFGMGGELIVKIIDEAPFLKDQSSNKRLILQPMTHPEKVREYLAANGFAILGETLSEDRGKIYQTICVEYDGLSRRFDSFTLHFGEYIISQRGSLFERLLTNVEKQIERKISGKQQGGESIDYEMALLEDIKKYIKR